MSPLFRYVIEPYGEHGWIVQLADTRAMIATALYANAVANTVRNKTGIADAVAGVESVVVKIDPAIISIDAARDMMEDALANAKLHSNNSAKKLEIPVCYGSAYGPDLEALGQRVSLSREEIVKAHSKASYRVLAIGFAPGFAYLGPLDPALAAPRLATPRPRVPAGSVAVAGAMSGVYPLPSPGGWNIIGRTPVSLFDATAADPFLFSSGMEVHFKPISDAEFQELESALR